MEVGAEIARIIIESRNTGAVKDVRSLVNTAIKEAEHILSVENSVTLRTLLVHEECLRAGVQCSSAMLIEIWTLSPNFDQHNEQMTKALDPLFLKNAVRSHLHFSQLNSWMTNNDGKLPNGLVFVYRLSCDDSTGIICNANDAMEPNDELKENHVFPTAKCGLSSLLTVSVKWKKFCLPPLLPCCPSFERSSCSLHEWVSPLGSISSSSSFGSLNESMHIVSSMEDESHSTSGDFGVEEDENSSGIYSASTSSHEPSLLRCGSTQSLIGSPVSIISDRSSVSRLQLSSRKSRCHDYSENGLERPPRKRSFFSEDIVDSIDLNSPTMRLLDKLEEYTATKGVLVKSFEVESLANALAESSSLKNEEQSVHSSFVSRRQSVPRRCRILSAFRFMSGSSTIFSKKTGLPLNSSPAPFHREEKKVKSLASSGNTDEDSGASDNEKLASAKAAPTNSGLLCNFEESILNGRLEPLASVEGFRLQITASGSFCSPHISLPVEAFFFNLSEDDAPSPNFGRCSLEKLGHKGYHIPKKGVIQATLFNPQGTVVCLFVVRFDVTEMPPSCQTFLRQRQFFMPPECPYDEINRSWLRYLIHLKLATDRRCRVFIHSDIRMLFSQKSDLDGLNVELEKSEDRFQLRAFTEMPQKPRFSPRK